MSVISELPKILKAGIAAAKAGASTVSAADLPWYEKSPGLDVVLGVRAIVPLVIFLVIVMKLVLGEKIREAGIIEPTDVILELKKLGAMIQTIYKDTATPKCEFHSNAPNYKYCGWHFGADSPNNTTNPYKESV